MTREDLIFVLRTVLLRLTSALIIVPARLLWPVKHVQHALVGGDAESQRRILCVQSQVRRISG